MKKIFRTAAFLAAMALATTSCQKENDDLMTIVGNSQFGSQVHYTVAGSTHRVILSDDEAWNLFLDSLFAMVKDGYTAEISGSQRSSLKYKETIIFTTTSETEAKNWTSNMVAQGYAVSISFDETTGVYTCIARK